MIGSYFSASIGKNLTGFFLSSILEISFLLWVNYLELLPLTFSPVNLSPVSNIQLASKHQIHSVM